jgi:zinc transporter 1/2/3
MFIDKNEIAMQKNHSMVASTKIPQVNVQVEQKKSCLANFTPFVLLIGLGSHAVFEGLALGIEPTKEKALIFAVAIALHKGAAGMSLGISMQKTFPTEKRFTTFMMTLFALFSPLGVILGIWLQDSDEMVEVVFSCLAGGTFLYISCSEVIVEEFSVPHFKFTKLFFFVLGIAMITSLHFLDG